jgi:membrane-bound lytic murein transglycosylase A
VKPQINGLFRTVLFGGVVGGLLSACAPVSKAPIPAESTTPQKPSKVELRGTTFSALPGWSTDRHAEALTAFQKSCAKILTLPLTRRMAANDAAPGGTVAQWQGPCTAVKTLEQSDDAAAKRFFETWFMPYEVRENAQPSGLFTGYYEPQLNGSWIKGGPYRTPLYARPADLVSASLGAFDDDLGGSTIWGRVEDGKLQPYAVRRDIETGRVPGLKPLLWVDSSVDAFFLHVQGSGQIKMLDGSMARVGFAGKNGRPYQSVGRILIDSGEISADRLTMDSIRDWVEARPQAGPELLQKNPSFVFFRLVEGDGPIGAQGVALTAGRSLAVDRRYLPLGAPLWLSTHEPLDANKPLQRLLIAQDTGGAIKGVVRGDIFFGSGPDAAKHAGNMKRPGRYYILLPLSVLPIQTAQ